MKENEYEPIEFEIIGGQYVCNKSEVRALEESHKKALSEIQDLKSQRDVAIEALEECDFSICRLCKVINPHHKDCTQCDDRDDLLKALSKLKGGIE